MILKVISDGNALDGTKVVNAETGEEVSGICEIDWHLDCDNLAIVTLKLYADVELASMDIKKIIIDAGASTYTEKQDDGTLKKVNRK